MVEGAEKKDYRSSNGADDGQSDDEDGENSNDEYDGLEDNPKDMETNKKTETE